MKIKEVTKAYIAGFIDGEGCISITKSKRRQSSSYCYALNVIISNTNWGVLRYIQKYYGGTIVQLETRPMWIDRYALRVGTHSSHKLLKDLRKYFIVKNQQVGVALEFMKIKKKYSGELGKKFSVAFLQLQEGCKLKMDKLNKRGK